MSRQDDRQTSAPQHHAGKQRPAAKLRYGWVRVTIWGQNSDKGSWYSVVPSRGYQDSTGWHSSSSFGRDDLLVLAKLCDQAHSWIHDQMVRDARSTNEEEQDRKI